MLNKISFWISKFFCGNFIFGLGLILGSIIGTVTTISVTMGTYGFNETISKYNKIICTVEDK